MSTLHATEAPGNAAELEGIVTARVRALLKGGMHRNEVMFRVVREHPENSNEAGRIAFRAALDFEGQVEVPNDPAVFTDALASPAPSELLQPEQPRQTGNQSSMPNRSIKTSKKKKRDTGGSESQPKADLQANPIAKPRMIVKSPPREKPTANPPFPGDMSTNLQTAACQLIESAWVYLNKEIEVWRTPFELARILRNLTNTKPEQFRDLIYRFYVNGRWAGEFEDLYYQYLDAFPTIMCPFGKDTFDVAAFHATSAPLTLSVDHGPKFQSIASFAYYMHTQADGGNIQLPRERLARWLGVSPRTVTSLVRLLEEASLVQCTDDAYSYAQHQAKTYKFIAGEGQFSIPKRGEAGA